MPLHALPQPRQRGFTLIEALVSLAILALGVLGLAAVQARMLVETRTTNSRAVAIRLIGELSERIQTNPTGANPPASGKSAYADGKAGGDDTPSFPDAPSTPSGDDDCSANNCTPKQQAAYDLAIWRQEVAGKLMGGKASIWQVSPRQLQVVVAWQANENTQPTLRNTAAAAATRQVAREMRITAADGTVDICSVASNTICHIDFIDIPPAK